MGDIDTIILVTAGALAVATVWWLWVPQTSTRQLADRLLAAPPDQAEALLARYGRKQVIEILHRALRDLSLDDRLPERADLVDRLVDLAPVDSLGWALALGDAGFPGPAERACRQVLGDQPGHIQARMGLAGLRRSAGDVEGALAILDGGARDEPWFLLIRAEIEVDRGRRDEAAVLLRRVLAQQSQAHRSEGHASYWAQVAPRADRLREMLLRDLEGDEAVLRDAASSGRLQPNSGINHTLVGLAAMARSARVATHLELISVDDALAAAVRGGDQRTARVREGEARLRGGDTARARSVFRGLVDDEPSFFPAQLGLGAALILEEHGAIRKLGNLPDALPGPEWLPVVPDMPVLTPEEKRVVAASAEPLRRRSRRSSRRASGSGCSRSTCGPPTSRSSNTWNMPDSGRGRWPGSRASRRRPGWPSRGSRGSSTPAARGRGSSGTSWRTSRSGTSRTSTGRRSRGCTHGSARPSGRSPSTSGRTSTSSSRCRTRTGFASGMGTSRCTWTRRGPGNGSAAGSMHWSRRAPDTLEDDASRSHRAGAEPGDSAHRQRQPLLVPRRGAAQRQGYPGPHRARAAGHRCWGEAGPRRPTSPPRRAASPRPPPYATRTPIRDRTVRLGPLARAPALRELHVQGARVFETEALPDIQTLRVVEFSFMKSPDLKPLPRLPLRRLVLDDVSGVRLGDLEGLTVEELDLWGCELADLGPLSTMPNLREVWIHGDHWWRVRSPARSLGPLMHLGKGARIVLDEHFDPERHREQIATLEARGAWIFAGRDPHEYGVHPSWWGKTADSRTGDHQAPRYVTGARPA